MPSTLGIKKQPSASVSLPILNEERQNLNKFSAEFDYYLSSGRTSNHCRDLRRAELPVIKASAQATFTPKYQSTVSNLSHGYLQEKYYERVIFQNTQKYILDNTFKEQPKIIWKIVSI